MRTEIIFSDHTFKSKLVDGDLWNGFFTEVDCRIVKGDHVKWEDFFDESNEKEISEDDLAILYNTYYFKVWFVAINKDENGCYQRVFLKHDE